MACGGCLAKQAGKKVEYVWTPAGGGPSITYKTEIEAKAKKIRSGGTYKAVNK